MFKPSQIQSIHLKKKKKKEKKKKKKYYYDNTFYLLSFYMINVKKFLSCSFSIFLFQ